MSKVNHPILSLLSSLLLPASPARKGKLPIVESVIVDNYTAESEVTKPVIQGSRLQVPMQWRDVPAPGEQGIWLAPMLGEGATQDQIRSNYFFLKRIGGLEARALLLRMPDGVMWPAYITLPIGPNSTNVSRLIVFTGDKGVMTKGDVQTLLNRFFDLLGEEGIDSTVVAAAQKKLMQQVDAAETAYVVSPSHTPHDAELARTDPELMAEVERRYGSVIDHARQIDRALEKLIVEDLNDDVGWIRDRSLSVYNLWTKKTPLGDIIANFDARLGSQPLPIRVLELGGGRGKAAMKLKERYGDAVVIDNITLHAVEVDPDCRGVFRHVLHGGVELQDRFPDHYDAMFSMYGATFYSRTDLVPMMFDHLRLGGESFFVMRNARLPDLLSYGVVNDILWSSITYALSSTGMDTYFLPSKGGVTYLYLRRTGNGSVKQNPAQTISEIYESVERHYRKTAGRDLAGDLAGDWGRPMEEITPALENAMQHVGKRYGLDLRLVQQSGDGKERAKGGQVFSPDGKGMDDVASDQASLIKNPKGFSETSSDGMADPLTTPLDPSLSPEDLATPGMAGEEIDRKEVVAVYPWVPDSLVKLLQKLPASEGRLYSPSPSRQSASGGGEGRGEGEADSNSHPESHELAALRHDIATAAQLASVANSAWATVRGGMGLVMRTGPVLGQGCTALLSLATVSLRQFEARWQSQNDNGS